MRNPWLCGVLLAAGCVDSDELDVSTVESPVMGSVVVQGREAPTLPGNNCTTSDVSDAEWSRFRTAITTDILPKARLVAKSPMYTACLRTTIKQGQILTTRGWDAPGYPMWFGPYTLRTGDRGGPIAQSMPLDRMRDLYAERMISESQGPHSLGITCMKQQGGASGGGENPTEDRARPENIHMSKDFYVHDPSPVPANYPFRAFTAAVIWHEVAHERGYHHPDPPPASMQAEYNAALAPIVGACMEQAFGDNEKYCGFATCPGGRMMLPPGGGDWFSCTCVPDQMTLVDSWDWPALTDVVVNSAGDGYALAWNGAVRTAYQRSGHAWNALGTATKIVANGDAVALRQTGPGFPKALQYWSIRPRVGPSETVTIVVGDGSSVAMDGFGTLYRTTTANRVERHRPYVGGWQDIGPGTQVTAGSDLAYLTSNGQLDRFNAATGSRNFISATNAVGSTVDAYGAYYALASDGTMVRWRGAFWEIVGWQDTAIGAGDNFYARSINGWVYRLNPEAGWQPIAMCDRFAAGGRSLYCVRGTRLELYAY